MVRLLEELVEAGIVLGLDGPAIGRVGDGGVRVVNGEVHREEEGDSEEDKELIARTTRASTGSRPKRMELKRVQH